MPLPRAGLWGCLLLWSLAIAISVEAAIPVPLPINLRTSLSFSTNRPIDIVVPNAGGSFFIYDMSSIHHVRLQKSDFYQFQL
jgi:hypothetical protein